LAGNQNEGKSFSESLLAPNLWSSSSKLVSKQSDA
jgi:hypothetical protein